MYIIDNGDFFYKTQTSSDDSLFCGNLFCMKSYQIISGVTFYGTFISKYCTELG